MGKAIFQDGKTYRQTFTGNWVADTTFFGNPKIDLDFWGNPRIKTDLWGNQIVERDLFGNPVIPVEYANLTDVGAHKGTAAGGGGGFESFLAILPFVLLAGGLFSVFATLAGSLVLVGSAVGVGAISLMALVADKVKWIKISNGAQPAFYILATGWVFGITPFWVHFFFNMNFDVSNTNYLTLDSLTTVVLPQMGLACCAGLTLATLFARFARSDMFAVRRQATQRLNRQCALDMLLGSLLPPILAVAISLAWTLAIAPILAVVFDHDWLTLANRQDEVMAVAFVLLALGLVGRRSAKLVRG